MRDTEKKGWVGTPRACLLQVPLENRSNKAYRQLAAAATKEMGTNNSPVLELFIWKQMHKEKAAGQPAVWKREEKLQLSAAPSCH